MGAGISEVAARAGFNVHFVEIDDERVKAGYERIEHSLQRAEASEKITAEEHKAILDRISGTTSLEDLAGVDIAIEAIPEILELKRQVFAELDSLVPEETVIATNTSSLPVIELGVATKRPQRVIGIHFFNPAPVMELVELVRTVTTDDEVLETAQSFIESIGKKPVLCRDRAGFIANVLLFPYLNEAVKLLEGGFASREDIDAAMRFGAAHPMGPLALLDLVGLDSCAEILESLYKQFAEQRYAPSPAFRHLVTAGYLGRKSGRGFYTYAEPDAPEVVQDGRSGRVIELPEPSLTVRTVGVVGTGIMGAGIVEVATRAGFKVVCRGRGEDSLEKAKGAITKSTSKAVEKGRLSESDRDEILGRIEWSTEIDSLADCDLVIEAVAEDLDLKRSVFAEIDKVTKDGAILATGTSSLPVV